MSGRRALDSYGLSLVVAGLLVVGGFVAFAIGWAGAAATLEVSLQTPYVVSSGFGGLGMIVVGAVIAVLQVRRRIGAAEARDNDDVVSEMRRMIEELRA